MERVTENEEVMVAAVRPVKRLLFLTVPMKGHSVHTARLAEYFLQFPEYEVNVGAAREVFSDLPEGVKAHPMPRVPEGEVGVSSAYFASVMAKAGQESMDWYHSQAVMMSEFKIEIMRELLMFGLDLTDRLRPDVVVCDQAFNLFNCLPTFCKEKGIPLVQITSMGRPETLFKPKNLMVMMFRYFSVFLKVKKGFTPLQEEAKQRFGMERLLPDKVKPITIYPSTEVLVETAPGPEVIFAGPFLPLPGLIEGRSSQRRPSAFSLNFSETPALEEWLGTGDQSRPIIYVALGTLVKPSKELMQRMVDGLDGGHWRIIWALPEAHRANLPRELGEHWHLVAFAPQFALLRSGRVSAFLSHCGGNSTMESLCQGVPMVCMPFFGDQYEWAQSVCTHAKAGVLIDKVRSTPDQIHKAVNDLLRTPSYKANAEAVAKKILEGGRSRLTWLQSQWKEKDVKIEKMTKVGVPVAAGVIDAMMHGKDPHDRLPPRAARESKHCCLPPLGF